MVFVICSEYVCLSIVFIIMLVILGGVIEEKKKSGDLFKFICGIRE